MPYACPYITVSISLTFIGHASWQIIAKLLNAGVKVWSAVA